MRPASHHQTEDRPDKARQSSARTRTARRGRAARTAALLALFTAIITVFHSSASYAWTSGGRASAYAAPTAVPAAERDFAAAFFSPALFQAAPAFESIETYAADCVTPKTEFTLGETICVKASVPFAFLVGRRNINIIGPSNVVRASLGVAGLEQTFSFALPTTAQSVIESETFDNRGTWRADLATSGGSRRASAYFDVSAATPAADLQILAAIDGNDTVETGASLTVPVYVFNVGPDAAANVVVTPPTHAGLTLQSFGPASGPDCGATCTIASLARRGFAAFVATYTVTAATGTRLAATATVGSATDDPKPLSNSDTIILNVGAVNPNSVCTLSCPANVVATANTTVGGQLGALVKYSAAGVTGDCGAVSNNPLSNSFFAVGTHTVTSTSETGGGSCTFTVKVLDTPAPTISCPANKTAIDANDSGDETVNVGTPAFTPSTGSITSLRSDSTPAVFDEDGVIVTPAVTKALTDPYPVGVTSIIWTVTDADGRTASCTQSITVSDNACGGDTTPPTITAPDDITVGTGAGNTVCTVTLDDELGQPEVNDDCAVSFNIVGAPAGNQFAPGTYTLTYTATNGAGLTASDTQIVTVVDDTTPIIAAPADATYTCPSEVPTTAAAASLARGPVVGPDGLFVRDANDELVFSGTPFENCGPAIVTVTDTNNGGAGSASNPRVITRTFTATDSANNSASAVQTITVADGTAPTISAPPAVTVGTGPGAVSCDANISNATLGSAVASDNCGGVTVTRSPSGNTFPVGTTTVTWTATDAVGNTATATQAVTVNDTTPPVISAPANVVVYLPLNSTATSRVVNYPNPATATDNCGGSISIGYSPASGSVFPVGPSTVTVTATDSHNNSSTATFTVTVLYNFTGFFSPVNNLPTLNKANGGQNIPLKFSLSGNKGLAIFATDFPASQEIGCADNVPVNELEETNSPGGSTLTYSPDTYHYNWKTEKSWAGTCRVLVVKLNDGSSHTAYFKFK